ncbi:MAG: HAD-IA family hydrolase, partial [Evtepia sp.]
PDESLRTWTREMQAAGIRVFILSNSRKPNRARIFAESLGVPFLGRAGKPKRGGFLRAMEQMGESANHTAMLGDQIFTDILGANRAGILSVLIKPVAFGTIFRLMRYGIETPFRLFGKSLEKS